MTFKTYITEQLVKNKEKKKILFIDGSDTRAQQAALKHQEANLIEPILLFQKKKEAIAHKQLKSICMEEWKEKEEELIAKYLAKRKGKEDKAMAQKAITDKNIFAMLMLEMNLVDGVIGGLVASTAAILRAAFKVVGPKPGIKTISSAMVMEKGDDWYIFGDISVNIEPNAEQLVDIAINATEFAKSLNFDPKVAFLSFSTAGSASHPKSILVNEATKMFNQKYRLNQKAIGEVQFDAAFSQDVRSKKYPGPAFKDQASIYIFPDLNAGNIGYKIAQRLGNFGAIGPIITGVNRPINDLSRGATVEDVYNTALITALQSFSK